MSDAVEAADAVIGTFDEHQLDGFGPWREVGPEEWSRCSSRRGEHATAYFEINVPGAESEIVHMLADRLVDDARPVFDPGAAADRARDKAIAEQLEAGR